MKLAERDFVARRRKGELPAIALLYGAEQGLIQQAVDEIWRTVLIGEEEDGPMDMATFHAGEVDGEKLHNACRARPFILSHRLVHLKLVEEATPAVKEVVLAYLKRPSPSTRLLLSGGNLEAAHPFRKQCESHELAWCVPFYALEGEK
ncbi:MAG: hypothetical protein HQL55_11055, partial [Magnetococcales bacterium]|nr:hypothetical protein [Magnetococcales bacterium]